jgi:hypothetical protein
VADGGPVMASGGDRGSAPARWPSERGELAATCRSSKKNQGAGSNCRSRRRCRGWQHLSQPEALPG